MSEEFRVERERDDDRGTLVVTAYTGHGAFIIDPELPAGPAAFDEDDLRWLMATALPAAAVWLRDHASVPSAETAKVEAGQIAGQTTIDEVLSEAT